MTLIGVEPEPDANGLHHVFLEQGSLYCTMRPTVISTLLGSCVAVCLVDRHRRAAGMNHYLLPHTPDGEPNLRYGDVAIEQLIVRMARLGCHMADLRAKVFGGASVLPYGAAEATVGAKNAALAIDWMRSHSIPVQARRTGGEHGLLIRLYTATGEALVRPITGPAHRPDSGRSVIHDVREHGPTGCSNRHANNAGTRGR